MEITQELVKEMFDYHEDGYLIWKKRTSNRICVGDKVGAIANHGYLIAGICGKLYKVHRLIWCYHYGSMPDSYIDHINGITNDNRISNLRLATYSQNSWNLKKPSHNSSGIKGVSWEKRRKRFEVYIQKNGKKYHLGYRFTLLDAAALIIAKRHDFHGEFARFK